jgi:hypothetical protein
MDTSRRITVPVVTPGELQRLLFGSRARERLKN